MKNRSWKTTSAGILLIVGGLTRLGFAIVNKEFTYEAVMTTASTVLTGAGLMFAKDGDKTGLPTDKNIKDGTN